MVKNIKVVKSIDIKKSIEYSLTINAVRKNSEIEKLMKKGVYGNG